ncbi:MAG TPA: DUF222 domain-containing protein [Candidatus Dormibacteraeota bacterium]
MGRAGRGDSKTRNQTRKPCKRSSQNEHLFVYFRHDSGARGSCIRQPAGSRCDQGRRGLPRPHRRALFPVARAARNRPRPAPPLQGSVTAIDWIRHNCRMSGHAAAERLCTGEKLETLAATAEATIDGRVGYAHLALIARTASWFDERPGTFQEKELLTIAEDCSVSRFRHVCHHARHAGNPDEYAADEEKVTEQRTMTMTLCEDGGYSFGGKLDAAGGAALRTALEPLARKSGAGDDRHKERRLADALVELAHHALDSGIVPQVAGQRPHLQVTAGFDTVLGRIGAPAGEMEFSLPISAKTIERLACECNLTRILLNSDSAIIDVGREKRVVDAHQVRALRARDRGCIWPGCDRPPSWTTAHHLKHWIHGGRTDMDNLGSLCHRHHRMVHEGGWELVRDKDGRILTIPPVPRDMWTFRAQSLGRDPINLRLAAEEHLMSRHLYGPQANEQPERVS